MPNSAVRQTNSNESSVVGRTLFCCVHIANVGAVIDTSLAGDSCSNTDIAAAVDVRTGRSSQGRVEVTDCVVIESLSTIGRVVLTAGVFSERSLTTGRVPGAGRVAKESKRSIGRVKKASRVV